MRGFANSACACTSHGRPGEGRGPWILLPGTGEEEEERSLGDAQGQVVITDFNGTTYELQRPAHDRRRRRKYKKHEDTI